MAARKLCEKELKPAPTLLIPPKVMALKQWSAKPFAVFAKKYFIATKVSPQNFRANDLRKSVEASLSKLGIETIDLLQLHHPNPAIPIAETMGAMSQLVDEGKIRFCGVSNFSVAEMQAAQKALGKYPIVSNQLRYNVIDRTIEKEILPYCNANGITVIAYSPLSKGLSRITDCDPTGVIVEIARATGKTPAQIIINWCICKEGVDCDTQRQTPNHAFWKIAGHPTGVYPLTKSRKSIRGFNSVTEINSTRWQEN